MDPLKKVRPGERLQIPARAWNRVLDTLGPNVGYAAGVDEPIEKAANIAMVLNDSGMPIPVCGVLGLGGIAIDPTGGNLAGTAAADSRAREFLQRPVLKGVRPTDANVLNVCIALEPVASGSIGRFAVGGMFPCKVKKISSSHRFARGRVDDVTQLITSDCGPVRLIWAETTNGDNKWAVGCM